MRREEGVGRSHQHPSDLINRECHGVAEIWQSDDKQGWRPFWLWYGSSLVTCGFPSYRLVGRRCAGVADLWQSGATRRWRPTFLRVWLLASNTAWFVSRTFGEGVGSRMGVAAQRAKAGQRGHRYACLIGVAGHVSSAIHVPHSPSGGSWTPRNASPGRFMREVPPATAGGPRSGTLGPKGGGFL